jgi:hypothetical protein
MNYKTTYYRIIIKDNREIVVTDVMSISVIFNDWNNVSYN